MYILRKGYRIIDYGILFIWLRHSLNKPTTVRPTNITSAGNFQRDSSTQTGFCGNFSVGLTESLPVQPGTAFQICILPADTIIVLHFSLVHFHVFHL